MKGTVMDSNTLEVYSFLNSDEHNSSYVRCWVISLDIKVKLDEVSFVQNKYDHWCKGQESLGLNSHITAELSGWHSHVMFFFLICKSLSFLFLSWRKERGREPSSSQLSQLSFSCFWSLNWVRATGTGFEVLGQHVTESVFHGEFPPFSKKMRV